MPSVVVNPTITINGIACNEIARGLAEGINEQGPWARKGFLCDWGNRYAVANGLLGIVSYSGPIGGAVVLSRPGNYPESANLWCREVSIEPVGTPSQGARQIQYPGAIVWASYGVPRFGIVPGENMGNDIDPDTPFVWCEQSISFSVETYAIPASAVQTDDGKPVPTDIMGYFPRADMSLTFHRVPYFPAQLIFNTIGKINDDVFLGGAPGQVIFNGGDVSRTASSDGSYTQDVHYSFSYRTVAPWSFIIHPDGVSGWILYKDKAGNPYIKSTDLTVLFLPGYEG